MLSAQSSLLLHAPRGCALLPTPRTSTITHGWIPAPASRRPTAPARRRRALLQPVRAVINKEELSTATSSSKGGAAADPQLSSLGAPSGQQQEYIPVQAVVTVRRKMKESLTEKAEEQLESFLTGIGQGIVVQLVSEEVDPGTNKPKRSLETAVRGWLPKASSHPYIAEYAADLRVPAGFGRPGAVVVTNLHKKELFLVQVVVHFDEDHIFFPANTWIHSRYDNPESRIIFSNQAYLPSQTPEGLKDMRAKDLASLRGNGKGERLKSDRIYDYATYNDLGNPDKDADLARPVLGGKDRPYPRRCRTGRPPATTDPYSESRVEKPHPVYVPRDETFEEVKQAAFSAGALKALLHNLIPSLVAAMSRTDSHFKCFTQIDELYKEGVQIGHDGEVVRSSPGGILQSVFKGLRDVRQTIMKYDVPSIISRDRFSWLRDSEFGRQTLAGVNPVNIERLKEFPIMSKLDPAVYGSPESAITKEIIESQLNGKTLEQAIEERRLFIVDYHDILLPYIKRMNSLKDRKAYASRTVFYLPSSGLLRPIAIELSLPPTPSEKRRKKVYTHGHDATTTWMWKLAKAHVCSNDAGVHQLVNHWLRTHASVEPYIIAAHRQLSYMHPVFKLLHPHMRYTLEINALARQSLINGGGIIEACFSPGRYALELSSVAYAASWRFDMEALPADLLRRGMAVEDPSSPSGLKLVIKDYPYAADGLLIWSAIKDWVHDYVSRFYPDNSTVASDAELQAWWDEVRNKGHADKRNEPWWPSVKTADDLEHVLTTIIWVASGQHAALNFGQYPFGGYMPNRPTLMKRLIPDEDDPEYEDFLVDPQFAFLTSLPTQLQATKVMAVQDTLSTHSPDEEYLGSVNEAHANWINDPAIVAAYERFSARLAEAEEVIHGRNRDKSLPNRTGAGVPPYELLLPTSGPGVTGRGIPNSISI